MPRTRANNGAGSGAKNGPVTVTQIPTFSDGATVEPAAEKATVSSIRRTRKTAAKPDSKTTARTPRPRKPSAREVLASVPVRPHPRAWESALTLAGGDASRLAVAEDGSVLIRNYSA